MGWLLGSLVIFLAGINGHSDQWIASLQFMGRRLIELMLVFLGLMTPAVHTGSVSTALHTATKARMKPAIHVPHIKPQGLKLESLPMADSNSMMFNTDPRLHHYNYVFEGIATLQNAPCPNASVLVRLMSGDRTVALGTVTNPDGSYRLEVGIDAADRSPVDWVIEAYSAEFDKLELTGRQIVHRHEVESQEPITVNTPVAFVISLSK